MLVLLDQLEEIINRGVGRDRVNIQTEYLDKAFFTDHLRNLYLMTDLIKLNCSVERVKRLRYYVKFYYNELNTRGKRK